MRASVFVLQAASMITISIALSAAGCSPAEKDPPGGSGGNGGSGGGSGAGAVSFARDIKPIFAAHCNDCHHPASATDYDFTNPFDPQKGIIGRPNTWAPNGAKETKVVDPGNVTNSSLITKVSREDLDVHVDGNPMPYHLPYLTTAEVDAVRQWITDGAKNDAFFAASVAPIFGTQVTLRREAGRCTYCHYPGAPSGMNVLDVFDPAQGMVGRTSRYGGKMVEPGAPDASSLMKKLTGNTAGAQMPLHRPRLSSAQVQRLRDWISAGARND